MRPGARPPNPGSPTGSAPSASATNNPVGLLIPRDSSSTTTPNGTTSIFGDTPTLQPPDPLRQTKSRAQCRRARWPPRRGKVFFYYRRKIRTGLAGHDNFAFCQIIIIAAKNSSSPKKTRTLRGDLYCSWSPWGTTPDTFNLRLRGPRRTFYSPATRHATMGDVQQPSSARLRGAHRPGFRES